MSQAPHCIHLRNGTKMGPAEMVDTMIKDGLWDAFNGYHMGNTAENVARQWQITREQQDEFALTSQNRAEAAQKAGRFKDEIVAGDDQGRKGDVVVDQDEYIRHGVELEMPRQAAPGLREGRHRDRRQRQRHQRRRRRGRPDDRGRGQAAAASPRSRASSSWAHAGVDPAIMGSGPIPASRKALEKAGWTVADLDLIEANEAFAAQACAVNKELGFDPDKVNVNGGAIAIGHPIGASGARVLTTLLFEMGKRDAKKGLATLCIGGGMGIAMCVER